MKNKGAISLKRYDLVSFGEVMLRLSPPQGRSFLNTKELMMEFGGAEANVLIGASIFGLKTKFITAFPANELGLRAKMEIEKYGVDCSAIKLIDKGRMGIYFVKYTGRRGIDVIYDRKNSSINFLDVKDIDFNDFEESKIVHLTGITPGLSQNARSIFLKIIKVCKGKTIICFDVNFRKKIWDVSTFKGFLENHVLRNVSILFISKNDLKEIFSLEDTPDSLKEFHRIYGTETIVCTLGSEGALVFSEGTVEKIEAYRLDEGNIVDRLGSGDAFVAGFIYGFLRLKNPFKAAQIGNAMAVVKLMNYGDFPSFTKKDVERILKSSLDFADR
ncbi:MAG TPA: sugar kinase [Thermotoga sp.]|nr:sugar kinase [Thermotoga sp.]